MPGAIVTTAGAVPVSANAYGTMVSSSAVIPAKAMGAMRRNSLKVTAMRGRTPRVVTDEGLGRKRPGGPGRSRGVKRRLRSGGDVHVVESDFDFSPRRWR